MAEILTAANLDLPRRNGGSFCEVASAAALPVLHETARAVLVELSDARGATREQWFPKAMLRVGWDADSQEDVFGPRLYVQRGFVARSDLWHWVVS